MRNRAWICAAAALGLLLAGEARAERGVQLTLNGSARLINKDVGDERWAIRVDEADGTIVGNVYRADGGPPQFVWCWPQSTADDPVRLRCQGTTGCDPWVDLGEVELPGSFLAPPASCEVATEDTANGAASVPSSGQVAAEAASTLRITPDGRRTLISKDVNGLRWSVVYEPPTPPGFEDHHLGRVTGNVFDPAGGPPKFVSCEGINGGTAENRFNCFGADACGCGPCDSSAWTPISEVALPRSFFVGRRCPSEDAPPTGLVSELTPSNPNDTDGFGQVIALDGTTAAVSAPDQAVYVYERGASGWEGVARMASPYSRGDEDALPRFGGSIALEGSTLFVSDDERVRIWRRGDNRWQEAGGFAASDAIRVALLASAPGLLVLSADGEDGRETLQIYEGSGSSWKGAGEVALPGEKPIEQFTEAAIEGGMLAVTIAGRYASGSIDSSVVHLYDHQGSEWIETARIEDPKFDVNVFGSALALQGDTLVIGSPPIQGKRERRSHDGLAYVWRRDGEGWHEVAALRTCGPDVGRFGSALALSGDLLAVAGADFPDGSAAGDVYLFDRSSGDWQESGRLSVAAAAPQHASLALSGTTLLAPKAGSVDVFDLAAPDIPPPEVCDESAAKVWPIGDWSVEDPTAHGMNPFLLERAREYAFRPAKHTQGVVVVRHGVIVAEWYEDGRDASSYAASWSSAKSVASAVIGIAIDRGIVPGVDVSLADYFPQWKGTDREAITLRNALNMMSGLSWSENYSVDQPVLSDIARLAAEVQDDLAFVLAKPLAYPPGTSWSYSSADTMLLSGVLQSALGRPLGEFAREELFDPIGMTTAEWWTDAVGQTLSWCCVDAPTREFARFGLLYARGGRWGDRQIVSQSWVHESGRTISQRLGQDVFDPGYGYQWWLGIRDSYRYTADAYEAVGFDEQHIYVFPSLDLVVVRNGHYDKDPGLPIADPNLFARYPAFGLGNGRGTIPPDSWSDSQFLRPIVESIVK